MFLIWTQNLVHNLAVISDLFGDEAPSLKSMRHCLNRLISTPQKSEFGQHLLTLMALFILCYIKNIQYILKNVSVCFAYTMKVSGHQKKGQWSVWLPTFLKIFFCALQNEEIEQHECEWVTCKSLVKLWNTSISPHPSPNTWPKSLKYTVWEKSLSLILSSMMSNWVKLND